MTSFTALGPGPDLPGPLRSRRTRMLIAAGVTGALTLIEPRELGPWQRAAEAVIDALSSPGFRWPRAAEVTEQRESEQAV